MIADSAYVLGLVCFVCRCIQIACKKRIFKDVKNPRSKIVLGVVNVMSKLFFAEVFNTICKVINCSDAIATAYKKVFVMMWGKCYVT